MSSNTDMSKGPSAWKQFALGVLSLSVPVSGISWWIYVAETTIGTQAVKVERFLNPFPSFLQDASLVTWIQLAFSALALLLFNELLKRQAIPKWLNVGMMGLAGLICFWLLFSLM